MTEQANSATNNPLPPYQAADENDFISLPSSDLYQYNREAVKQFGFLDNQGIALDDDEGGEGAVHIDSLYVVPYVSVERMAPEVLAREEIEDGTSDNDYSEALLKVAHVLWKNPRLTLLGDPGVGKTTLTQWLMCSLCHPSKNYAKENIGPLFPLLLTARKLKPAQMQSPVGQPQVESQQFIETIIGTQAECLSALLLGDGSNSNNTKSMDCLLSCFASGQLLLIIDGLDEISLESANWLQAQLRQLLTSYPKIRLLMTSRVVGFDPVQFWQIVPDVAVKNDQENDQNSEQDCETLDVDMADQATKRALALARLEKVDLQQAELPSKYYLAPFTPSQRKQFSTNWVNHYLPPVEEKRQSFMHSMDNVSNHNIQLNALSRIPVLLNLICFVLWRRGKLPDGRAELYQDIVRTYLTTMDKSRGIKHELSDEYDYQDIKNWLGKLALQMHCGQLVVDDKLNNMDEGDLEDLREKLPTIKRERLLQVSESQLKAFLQLQLSEVINRDDLATHSKQLIHYLQTRTGFLIPKGQLNGEEQFGFSHLSFQEYFAAYAISLNTGLLNSNDEFGAKLIHTTAHPAWAEVWQLVFEQLSLAGTSRKQIDVLLRQVFASDFDDGDCFVLYSKIIVNPAIKLVATARDKRKVAVVSFYLEQLYSNHLLTELTNECYRNNKLKPLVLQALTENKRLDFMDKGFPVGLTNDCLAKLSQCKQLNRLLVNGVDVDNFDWLKHGQQLETLHIHNLKEPNEAALMALFGLTQLKTLWLPNNTISDFSGLSRLKHLERLSLGDSGFNSLAILAELQQLQYLDLRGCPINNLTDLLELPKLRKLIIDKTVTKRSQGAIKALKDKGVSVHAVRQSV